MERTDIPMNNTPVPELESSDSKGVQVNLISEDGTLEILFLPKIAEGKYFFRRYETQRALSFVSIEAEAGHWMICCDESTCFLGEYAVGVCRVPLKQKHLYYLNHSGERYILCAERQTTNSGMFHNYRVVPGKAITIGRAEGNDIVSTGRFVSRSHAAICLTGTGWEIRDLGSANGVYVNRRRVTETKLKLGDKIYLMGVRIIVGTDFLSICPGDNEIRINPAVLFPVELRRTVGSLPTAAEASLFNRSPRSRFSMDWKPIEIDSPPMPMSGNKMPLILRMGSSAVMGGRSILLGSYSMALTSLVFPFLTQRYNEKERKEYEERRIAKYTEYLAQKKKEIADECAREYHILTENYPALNTLLRDCGGKRLWERRKSDDDFLTLRVGAGVLPMQAEVQYQNRRFEMEPDVLEEKMFDLAEKQYLIEKAPIMVSLMQDYVIGIVGHRPAVLQLIWRITAQLAITHSYDEVKCIFLLEEQELKEFPGLQYLPHLWDDERSIRFLAVNQPEACAIGEYLRRELQEQMKGDKNSQKYRKNHPYYVVFALNKHLCDAIEVLKEILTEEEFLGLSLVTAYDELPKECTRVFQMRSGGTQSACFDLRHPDLPAQKFFMDECDTEGLKNSIKKLANTRLKNLAGSFNLPKSYTFLEMFGVGKIEHLNILKRWNESDPTRSLGVPVGIGTDGELFMLDLHEKRQGPHGLIAGMTGSGKSEFIITYILSLAVNFSPDEVAFVLIDYKGGGLAGAFEDEKRAIHLPHLVGTITNLDGAAVTRSMISIESELKRRQRIFNEAKSQCNEGTMDIYTYQRLYRSHRVSEPLPHLFIISDEFAELKSQQPEFMDKLISTARIGRSLGVHLILATQKPAGVVNDQIWSNTRFRICLRVQDKTDSQDMLKRPEAAELKETGRFYLQVGYNEYFALGQSAWCGADYIPQEEVLVQKDESIQVIDHTAQVILNSKPVQNKKSAGIKQIVAIVQHLSSLAQREKLIPRQLLPPMLAKELTMVQLRKKYPKIPAKISAQIGIIDDPAFQKQYAFELNLEEMHNLLIVGESGCGKTSLIQTLLLSVAERYSPEQVCFYILDFSSKLFPRFQSLPHCGAVLTDENESDIDRLFDKVTQETKRRQKLFAQAQVNSFSDYCKIQPLPLMLIVIDGMVNFSAIKKGSQYYSTLQDYMRDGAGYGIQFILAASHYNEFSIRVRQEASVHLGMNLKDRYSYYDVLGVRTDYQPPALPGRGMCIWDSRPLEFHTALFTLEKEPQLAAQQLAKHLQEIAVRNAGFAPASKLTMISETESYTDFRRQFAPGRIPLGYTLDKVKPVAIPLRQLFSLSLYFGNPIAAEPVLDNLLEAFCAEKMELVIVKRRQNSLFDPKFGRITELSKRTKITLLESREEDVNALTELLIEQQTQRCGLRNEYAEQKGLEKADPENALRAFEYIRERTAPIMVVFEWFYEFASVVNHGQGTLLSALLKAAGKEEDAADPSSIWRRGRGYNIYYTGCFFPGDITLINTRTELADSFNPQQLALMFGGRLDKVGLSCLTREYKGIREMSDKYNRFLLHYNGTLKSLLMPCGELIKPQSNPDEEPII